MKPFEGDAMKAWKDEAADAITTLAASGRKFTSDDLVDMVGHPDLDHEPNSRNNAIGPVFMAARRRGEIKVVGHRNSKQPHRKGGLVRVWQGVA